MALEGDCGVPKKGQADNEEGGLPGVMKGLFAGRLVNYIEVRVGWVIFIFFHLPWRSG